MIDVEKVPSFNSVNGEVNYFVNVTEEKIKELEKLKAEFEEDKYILLNQTTAIKVIDNYIEELKGDTNGNNT